MPNDDRTRAGQRKIEGWVSEESADGWDHARAALGVANLTALLQALGKAWPTVDLNAPLPADFLQRVAAQATATADERRSRRRPENLTGT